MKKAFTLIEVNLAILVMAGGILSVVVLYSLGFRETRQSREDIGSAAYADAVLSPLAAAFSATNVTWESFRELKNYPADEGEDVGWGVYLKDDGTVVEDPDSKAKNAFGQAVGALKFAGGSQGYAPSYPQDAAGGLKAGLVIMHNRNSAVVRIGFRATKRAGMLLSAPQYYTEVRFQGVEEGGGN